MVFPVPGLPVKMRCRLWSSTGRPRSARIFCTRSRFVTSFTSCFTPVEPHEGVELREQLVDRPRRADPRSAGTGLGPLGGGRPGDDGGPTARLHLLDGAEEHPAEALDGRQLAVGRVEVDGGHREGDLDRRGVVAAGVGGGAAAIGGEQHLEHGRGLVGEAPLGVDQTGVPEGLRGGAGELGLEQRTEGAEHLPQLVVADAAIDGHQAADEVEGLEGDVLLQLVRAHPGDAAADLGRARP